MNKGSDFNYDKEQWEVVGNRIIGYNLVNKFSKDSYLISGKDEFGIQQLSDNDFLIFHSSSYGKRWEAYRVTLDKTMRFGLQFSFKEEFCFLTKDTILFDNKLLYSISKDSIVDEFTQFKSSNIEVVHNSKDHEKVALFVEKCISTNEYVQVLVDSISFKPISPAYSTLRNSFIPLTDSFSFHDLVTEDIVYEEKISYYLHEIMRNKGKNFLLSQF